MKILLDAYFDNNFGDDLFIDTLLGRYPQARFYVFWKKAHPQVLERARRFQNLIIMPGNCELQWMLRFDGYIMIGGDVLPDGIDYSERVAWMSHVKGNGGFVAMLGFSLYKTYGEKTRTDLHTMAMLADAIVIRDHYSAKRFQGLVPDVAVVESTDMAFAREYGNLEEKNGIWSAVVEDAIVKADENGNYAIPDVVPGRYYIKFTYGNGETKYKDLSGNKISIGTKIKGNDSSINTDLYKSTILTGPVVGANADNEKTWFLNEIDKNNIKDFVQDIKNYYIENSRNDYILKSCNLSIDEIIHNTFTRDKYHIDNEDDKLHSEVESYIAMLIAEKYYRYFWKGNLENYLNEILENYSDDELKDLIEYIIYEDRE